jgi:hypothetical protein
MVKHAAAVEAAAATAKLAAHNRAKLARALARMEELKTVNERAAKEVVALRNAVLTLKVERALHSSAAIAVAEGQERGREAARAAKKAVAAPSKQPSSRASPPPVGYRINPVAAFSQRTLALAAEGNPRAVWGSATPDAPPAASAGRSPPPPPP